MRCAQVVFNLISYIASPSFVSSGLLYSPYVPSVGPIRSSQLDNSNPAVIQKWSSLGINAQDAYDFLHAAKVGLG